VEGRNSGMQRVAGAKGRGHTPGVPKWKSLANERSGTIGSRRSILQAIPLSIPSAPQAYLQNHACDRPPLVFLPLRTAAQHRRPPPPLSLPPFLPPFPPASSRSSLGSHVEGGLSSSPTSPVPAWTRRGPKSAASGAC
jgi:hypothetical protein